MKKVTIFAVIFFTVFRAVSLNSAGQGDIKNVKLPFQLNKGWEYIWEDPSYDNKLYLPWTDKSVSDKLWRPLDLPGTMKFSGSDSDDRNYCYLWLRRAIPALDFDSPSIFIKDLFTHIDVYIDEERIYSFKNVNASGNEKFVAFKSHLIKLGNDSGGKTIYFRISSYKKLIGIQSGIFLDSHSNHILRIIKSDIDKIILSCIFIFISFFSLFFFIRQRESSLFLYFGIYLLFIPFYILRHIILKDLFFDYPRIWTAIWLVAPKICIVVLIIFIIKLLNIGKKSLLQILFIINILFTIAVIVSILAIYIFYHSDIGFDFQYLAFHLRYLYLFIILFDIVVIIGVLIKHSMRGDRDAKIMLIGTFVYGIIVLSSVISSLQLTISGYEFKIHWGMFIFVLSMLYIMVNRFSEINENLIRIEEELVVARQIQLSILPETLPKLKNFDIAAAYLPLNSVGGDFYDFIIQDENRIGVIVTDVSGHGVPSALISSMVKIAFHQETENVSKPEIMLQNINRNMANKFQKQFLTACYVYIDKEKGFLNTANAAHVGLILLKRNGELAVVNPRGRIIGIFDEIKCESESTDIEKGDRIVIYTDGIIEGIDKNGEIFGDNNLLKIIEEKKELAGQDLIGHIIERISLWIGLDKGFDDDITIVVIDIK